MSTKVVDSFVQNFQADVHLQYQQIGSELRNTVRSRTISRAPRPLSRPWKGTASTRPVTARCRS